ncbi:hypothetical protein Bca4012_053841 [Brassica carinata]
MTMHSVIGGRLFALLGINGITLLFLKEKLGGATSESFLHVATVERMKKNTFTVSAISEDVLISTQPVVGLPAATKLQTWMPNLYYQHLQLHVHAPRRARKVDEANLPSFENEEKSRKRPRE